MKIPTVVALRFFSAKRFSRYTRNVVHIITYVKLKIAEGTNFSH